jgi:hypothetical protein
MKISDDTVTILKNFSTINQSLLFKEGNVLRTISPLKTVYVEAVVSEDFPKTCALYDLNKFLAKISLYKQPVLNFDEDKVFILTEDSRRKDYIKYASVKVITTPPDKGIDLGQVAVSFDLSEEDLDWMRKSAGISGSPNFVFESDGENVWFVASDVKDDAADVSRIQIGKGNDSVFKVVLKVENFKMIAGSYNVSVSKKGVALFSNIKLNIKYYVAIESGLSTFGE